LPEDVFAALAEERLPLETESDVAVEWRL
jgi:hypothetical protein